MHHLLWECVILSYGEDCKRDIHLVANTVNPLISFEDIVKQLRYFRMMPSRQLAYLLSITQTSDGNTTSVFLLSELHPDPDAVITVSGNIAAIRWLSS